MTNNQKNMKKENNQDSRDKVPKLFDEQKILVLISIIFLVSLILFGISKCSGNNQVTQNNNSGDDGTNWAEGGDENQEPESEYMDAGDKGVQPVWNCPQPDEVASSTLVTYQGQRGTYTFGMNQQPESVYGICLNPTYEAYQGETPKIGIFITPTGCETWVPLDEPLLEEDDGTTILDEPIVRLSNMSLTTQSSTAYKDENSFGVAWNLNFIDDISSMPESHMIIRAIDLDQNELLDIIDLAFGKGPDGKYTILSAENACVSDTNLISLALEEMVSVLNEEYSIDNQFSYFIRMSADFDVSDHGSKFFVQEMRTESMLPHCYHYRCINAENGEWLDNQDMEYESPVYAVNFNMSKTYGAGVLYMIETTSDSGTRVFKTIAFDPLYS